MKRWFAFGPALATAMLLCAGCSQQIPQGHVGKVLTASGWGDGVSDPGYVACWGRDELYLLATGDDSHTERLNVLCTDKLNFHCDLVIVSRPKSDQASRNAIFLRVKAQKDDEGRATIGGDRFYDVYVKPVVVPAAYEIVSRRGSDEIGGELVEIKREIVRLCRQRMGPDAPVEIALIDFTNTDYPETVTLANEARKRKEIDIEIARIDAAIEEAKAEGRLRAADKEYQARLLEAKMIADANRIIGESLSEHPLFLCWQFLHRHQIKVYGEAAAGLNNAFIIPYGAMGHGEPRLLASPWVRDALERAKPSDIGYADAVQRRLADARQAAEQAERSAAESRE